MKAFFRYGTFPLLLLGANAAIIALLGAGAPYWQPFAVLGTAVAFMFTAERVIPYVSDWNADHEDAWTNALHALANTVLSHAGVFALPWLAAAAPLKGLWPSAWPFWLQVVASILVLDLGISAAHHASHRWHWLWRFHAVHHSARRLYGLNGLMKHPVHQMIETLSGVGPLWLLGIPQLVAAALAFCVAVQLLLQHANADYRTGPLKYLFANAEVHRFHHVNRPGEGDVNFGLFTALYDHLAGTFCYRAGAAPRASAEVGLADAPDYPRGYLAQLAQPFRSDTAY
ncbi:MAG: sterol desaturase family protein [Nevskia sp.]|nr:sterol desaturase family protein [Nevskia sp.]